MPSYTLAPTGRVAEMTREVARAVDIAADIVAGPIRLAGHSAGGHLATRLVCDDSPLAGSTADRIAHVLSISGLHDLRPLLQTRLNDSLGLSAADATAESPALAAPRPGTRLTAWVGADELPEFVRQSALLANAWAGLGAATRSVRDPGLHHFNVIEGLADPSSPIAAAFIED